VSLLVYPGESGTINRLTQPRQTTKNPECEIAHTPYLKVVGIKPKAAIISVSPERIDIPVIRKNPFEHSIKPPSMRTSLQLPYSCVNSLSLGVEFRFERVR